jgi:hypothetical protein
MPTVTPDMETVYARAADLRADGWTWAATARALDLDAEELKALCRGSTSYTRRLARARRELMHDTLTESMLVLRVQLRTGNPAESQKAAEALCRVENTFRRHRNAREGPREGAPAGPAERDAPGLADRVPAVVRAAGRRGAGAAE